jgi:flagellar biosynthesis chaperone FliJ
MKDPADDVTETLKQIKARLEAMKMSRPSVESNLRRMRIAVMNAEKQLENYDRSIAALEEVVAQGGRKNNFEIAVERVADPDNPPGRVSER